MANKTLAQTRTRLENITGTLNDATYPGSQVELDDINAAYEKTAYKYLWHGTLKRWYDVVVAFVDRYALQTDLRRMQFMRAQNQRYEPTDIDHIYEGGFRQYALDLNTREYILGQQPNVATTAFTFSGSYTAGSAVVITLNSVTGISQGDEIFISDGTASEFTKVQSVDGTGITITVKIANNHNNKTLYRTAEGNYMQYQQLITLLSASGDVTSLPSELDLIIPEYAAYLYYMRIEEPDRAETHLQVWETACDEAWLAQGRTEAGSSGQFVV